MDQGNRRAPRRWLRMAVVIATTAAFVAPTAVWAVDKFTDVPDSNVFHDDIAWLADAEVTLGCNPPDNTLFCPSDNVTREQMAAFMKRLAENQVVDAATAVEAATALSATDAGALDGQAPEAYETIISGTTPTAGSITLTSGTNQAIQELTITAPTDGYLAIDATSSFFDTQAGDAILMWLQVDNTTCSNSGPSVQATGFGYLNTDLERDSLSLGGTVAVSAGDHTVTLCAREFAGAFDPTYQGATIQTVFSAQGSVGIGLASADTDAALPGTSG